MNSKHQVCRLGMLPIGSEEMRNDGALQQKALMMEMEMNIKQPLLLPKQIHLLEDLFESIYTKLQPQEVDYLARFDAIKLVEDLVRDKLLVHEIVKNYVSCNAKPFGSFIMDMFTPSSDLDISLHVEHGLATLSREQKVKILKRLTKILHGLASRKIVRAVQPILKAKVPIVKFIVCKTGLECDVSVENRDGVIKSQLLRIFSSIDPRFRALCFLVKAWANSQGINSSKDHTLNSLSIILLVAFHLQTRTPAILPPFSALLNGLQSPFTAEAISVISERVNDYKGFGRGNVESVVELFNSLLLKLSAVQNMWPQGLCASTYEGKWSLTDRPNCIFVEDFTALSQNAARAVDGTGFTAIYKKINEAIIGLKVPGEMEIMKRLLFPPTRASAKQGKKHGRVDVVDSKQTPLTGAVHRIDAEMHRDYPSKRAKMLNPVLVSHPYGSVSQSIIQSEMANRMYTPRYHDEMTVVDHVRSQALLSFPMLPTCHGYLQHQYTIPPHHRLTILREPVSLRRLGVQYDRRARWPQK